MREKSTEDKILSYLLGECTEEEAFEVEKMCLKDPIWQAEKVRFVQVLGLVEESIRAPNENLITPVKNKLSEHQRVEIKTLMGKSSNDEVDSNVKEMKKTKKNSKKSNIIYWIPLAIAASAAIIAYFGSPDDHSKDLIGAATKKAGSSDQNLTFANDKLSIKSVLAEPKISGIISTDTELALQKAIADGANETLALRTRNEIRKMEKTSVNDLPTGKELIKKLEDLNVTLKNGVSDSVLLAKTSPFPKLADNFSEPLPDGIKKPEDKATLPILLSPKINHFDTNDGNLSNKETSGLAIKTPSEQIKWFSVITEPEESFIFNEKRDSLGKIRILGSPNGKIIFERANWSNKNRNFALKPGVYEVRLSHQKSGILIVKGTVTLINKQDTYELSISEAWELDKDEKRNSIPIENLNR